jgi:ADP-ribose pyrophosphatase YjhB (NUDIX family)
MSFYNNFEDNKVKSALLVVVDKHLKQFVGIWKNYGSFDIPGGKCRIYNSKNGPFMESYEDCAIRELKEETGLDVEKDKIIKLLDANDEKNQVVTFITYNYSGQLHTEENHNVGWLKLEKLKENDNPFWARYNHTIFQRILFKIY